MPTTLLVAAIAISTTAGAWYLQQPTPPKPFDPRVFSKAVVTSHTRPTASTSLLRLRLLRPPPTPPPFYALLVKSPHVQIERPYTPLRGLERDQVELWIKRETSGEVSGYLAGKKVGDQVDVRGWAPGIEWADQGWDEVVMISGGTGITPFYQLLHHLFLSSNPRGASPNTHFTLLHGSPSPSELPPASMLAPIASLARQRPDVFTLRLFVDFVPAAQPLEVTLLDENLPLAVRRISKDDLSRCVEPPSPPTSFWNSLSKLFGSSTGATLQKEDQPSKSKILFLVCGPEPMVEAFAGPRARDLTEGDIGGILGAMGYGKGEVRKL